MDSLPRSFGENKDINKTKKLLLITSRPPSYSAGLGQDVINALSEQGYQVDVLSLYGQQNQPSNMISILPYKFVLKDRIISFLQKRRFIRKLWHQIRKLLGIQTQIKFHYLRNNGISIVYPDESKPDIDVEKVLSYIKYDYDIVMSLFWQDFINSKTLNEIYKKQKCPILIYSVDMAPFTGGCYYFGNCRNFEKGCGNCPAMASNIENDDSRKNFLKKKFNYSQMECYFLGNTWMIDFARKSNIFNENQVRFASIVLNSNEFTPDKNINNDKISLPKGKEFGIMFRAMPNFDARKGEVEFEKMMQLLYDQLGEKEREKIIILPVGCYLKEDRKSKFKFDVMDIGMVSKSTLINLYRISSVFVSPSLDDAGPSMVNQAMMCGTPVLAFNIGTAIDMIDDGVNGYKSSVGDINHLVKGLFHLIKNQSALKDMSENARLKAIAINSYNAFNKNFSAVLENRYIPHNNMGTFHKPKSL